MSNEPALISIPLPESSAEKVSTDSLKRLAAIAVSLTLITLDESEVYPTRIPTEVTAFLDRLMTRIPNTSECYEEKLQKMVEEYFNVPMTLKKAIALVHLIRNLLLLLQNPKPVFTRNNVTAATNILRVNLNLEDPTDRDRIAETGGAAIFALYRKLLTLWPVAKEKISEQPQVDMADFDDIDVINTVAYDPATDTELTNDSASIFALYTKIIDRIPQNIVNLGSELDKASKDPGILRLTTTRICLDLANASYLAKVFFQITKQRICEDYNVFTNTIAQVLRNETSLLDNPRTLRNLLETADNIFAIYEQSQTDNEFVNEVYRIWRLAKLFYPDYLAGKIESSEWRAVIAVVRNKDGELLAATIPEKPPGHDKDAAKVPTLSRGRPAYFSIPRDIGGYVWVET